MGDLVAEALTAVDAILWDVFRIAKALDPLDPKDLLVIERQLAAELVGLTGAAEAAALRSAIDKLDVEWSTLSAAQTDKIVGAARAALSKPSVDWKALDAKTSKHGVKVANATRASLKGRYGLGIASSVPSVDKKVLQAMAFDQGSFVRNEYGKRAEAMSLKARKIVSSGVAQGKGREELKSELQAGLGELGAKRSAAYWRTVASSFTVRARSYTELTSYAEMGIEKYRLEAVLDKATTPQCRYMHGRTYSVKVGLDAFKRVHESKDPEAVKLYQPWMYVGKRDDGTEYLYHKTASGSRAELATITSNASGKVDQVGSFRSAGGGDGQQALVMAGISTPPFHGNCRTVIVPVGDF